MFREMTEHFLKHNSRSKTASNPFLLLGAVAACLMTGCHGQNSASLASDINMNDTRLSRQLLSGFYGPEGSEDKWRWTGPVFKVALGAPTGASGHPATSASLVVRLYIPPSQIEKLGPITLRAAGPSNQDLGQKTFTAGGMQLFTAPVPADVLSSNPVRITFSLDKYLPHSAADARDLGVIVSDIKLSA
jgi:hypothetical protein